MAACTVSRRLDDDFTDDRADVHVKAVRVTRHTTLAGCQNGICFCQVGSKNQRRSHATAKAHRAGWVIRRIAVGAVSQAAPGEVVRACIAGGPVAKVILGSERANHARRAGGLGTNRRKDEGTGRGMDHGEGIGRAAGATALRGSEPHVGVCIVGDKTQNVVLSIEKVRRARRILWSRSVRAVHQAAPTERVAAVVVGVPVAIRVTGGQQERGTAYTGRLLADGGKGELCGRRRFDVQRVLAGVPAVTGDHVPVIVGCGQVVGRREAHRADPDAVDKIVAQSCQGADDAAVGRGEGHVLAPTGDDIVIPVLGRDDSCETHAGRTVRGH